MLFRFVGSDSEIGQIRVHEFGTLLDLDAQTSHDAVMSRVGLVADADFQAIGITDDELTQFSDAHTHVDAPTTFKEKVTKAHKIAAAMYHEYLVAATTGDTFMTRAAKPVQKPSSPRVVDPVPTQAPAPKEQ